MDLDDKLLKQVDELVDEIRKNGTTDGVVECPACEGQMLYIIDAYNNHVHLVCDKEDCLRIRE